MLRSCASLWILGMLGMWAARVFGAGAVSEAPFRIAAGCWVLGGIGFTCFAVLGLLDSAHARPRSEVERQRASR